jgi:hypothetical protein
MATCPRCGEEVAARADTCSACGAALRLGRQIRWYLVSTATLAAIIVAAALLHSYLEGRVVRSPLEFVPESARAVVVLDLRPGSAAGQRVVRTWPAADREALGVRAYDLAQRMVDWTGLRLDLREEAAQWFGGEVVVASIGGPEARSFAPRSFVLVARVTSLRRARADLHEAVEELARQNEWQRRTLRVEGRTITVWGPAGGDSEIAYAAADGCLIVSASHELLELCLRTADDPSARLTRTAHFREVRTRLPGDALVWGYLDASDLLQASREALPSLRQGWVGLVRYYLASRSASQVPRSVHAPGDSIAVAITPEREGMRVHASYLGGSGKVAQATAPNSARLLELVPREAVAFAFLRDLPNLVNLLAGREQPARRAHTAAHWGILGLPLPAEVLPESLLVTILPRQGAAGPAVAAAFAGENSQQSSESLLKVAPMLKAAELSGAQVVATDDESIRRMQAAGKLPAERLQVEFGTDVAVQVWAKPAALSPELARVEEIGLTVRRGARGGDMEVRVKAEPRHLLGGG